MKDIWLTFNGLRDDAINRGMFDLSLVYGNSAVRMGMEILDDFTNKQTIYDQMDCDIGDLLK